MRREDPALLTGRGRYVDDVAPEGALHAFVVRSPLAHARILSVDVTEAREAPGVVAVYTAADLPGVGPLPGAEGLPPGSLNPEFPVLASGKVLWAGQPVVLVVAETSEQAADAAELVMVDYDELPAVTGPLDAAADGAPVLHDGAESNIAVRQRMTTGDAAAAFESAAYRVGQRMVSQRIAPVALEPRGVLASVAADGRLEVRLPTQRPHGSRNWLAKILGMPPAQIHVAAGDVGGAFGAKGPVYPDQVAVIAAARALRPAGEVDRGAQRVVPRHHARPGPGGRPGGGGGRERADHRDARHRARELRRLLHPERPRLPPRPPRPHAPAGLPDRALRRRADRGLREYHPDRPVPRRRPPGGRLLLRAPRGPGGPARRASTPRNCAAGTSSRRPPSRTPPAPA